MKNKFFPTFQQDISATLKLCVLTVFCVVFISWAVFTAEKALKKAYKKLESDVFKQYAGAQTNPQIEGKKSTIAPVRQRATSHPEK